MGRRERIFVAGGIYHVYCRVARGEPVFDNTTEIEAWIQSVAHTAWLHDITVLAWCLMSNHYHLVIRSGTVPLWRAMAVLQGRVAKGFNRRRRYMGRLWQSRYRARFVPEQKYLDHLYAYVHLNPVAAGIVQDPADYLASGHCELLGLVEPQLCDVRSALSSFHCDITEARRIYLEKVRFVAEVRWLSTGVKRLPWWRTAPDKDETVGRDDLPDGAVDFLGQPLPPERFQRPDLPKVVRFFERECGLAPGELAGQSRVRILAYNRAMFATFAVSWLGYRSKDVAAVLAKAPGSVSRWVSEGLDTQRSNERFRNAIANLRERFQEEWPETDIAESFTTHVLPTL